MKTEDRRRARWREAGGQTEGRDGHDRETSQQQRRTGWQKINRLKPREQSDGGDGRGKKYKNCKHWEKYAESVSEWRVGNEDKWKKISRLKKKYESGSAKINKPIWTQRQTLTAVMQQCKSNRINWCVFLNRECVSDRVWSPLSANLWKRLKFDIQAWSALVTSLSVCSTTHARLVGDRTGREKKAME